MKLPKVRLQGKHITPTYGKSTTVMPGRSYKMRAKKSPAGISIKHPPKTILHGRPVSEPGERSVKSTLHTRTKVSFTGSGPLHESATRSWTKGRTKQKSNIPGYEQSVNHTKVVDHHNVNVFKAGGIGAGAGGIGAASIGAHHYVNNSRGINKGRAAQKGY